MRVRETETRHKNNISRIARWEKTIAIDDLFRQGFSRKQICESLNLKPNYVGCVLEEERIKDVPEWFKNEKKVKKA